jgi:hypothetical protein
VAAEVLEGDSTLAPRGYGLSGVIVEHRGKADASEARAEQLDRGGRSRASPRLSRLHRSGRLRIRVRFRRLRPSRRVGPDARGAPESQALWRAARSTRRARPIHRATQVGCPIGPMGSSGDRRHLRSCADPAVFLSSRDRRVPGA